MQTGDAAVHGHHVNPQATLQNPYFEEVLRMATWYIDC